MTVPAAGPTGWLSIEVDANSYLPPASIPVVVRDARGAVVRRIGSDSDADQSLSAGLYSVSAVTADGSVAVKHAQIREAETTQITFGTPETTAEPPARPGFLRGLETEPVLLELADGCGVADSGEGWWEFAPLGWLHSVPWADFGLADRHVVMSLPLNPDMPYPYNSCRVSVVRARSRIGVRVSFPPERRAARLVDGLVRHGEIASGTNALRQSTQLLSAKYSDAPGAVLGGLTLDRMGLLSARSDWVENLARDFPWLPDGLALLASLLRHSSNPDERERGLGLLLAAAAERPLYTDGLSLLMELLRRWPDEASKDQRHDMLDKLAAYSAYADWDSVNLSVELTGRP